MTEYTKGVHFELVERLKKYLEPGFHLSQVFAVQVLASGGSRQQQHLLVFTLMPMDHLETSVAMQYYQSC